MKRRDFLHLAIAGTAAASAQPLFAREQQTGAVGANNRIRIPAGFNWNLFQGPALKRPFASRISLSS